ncbi:MAG: hypothetical protein ACLQU1_22845 [Bryobacteraceae bacterium]
MSLPGNPPPNLRAYLADLYYIRTACHNPASPVGTMASRHAASAMREFAFTSGPNG